jgi:AcrR family transcriptional regulator
MSRLGLRERKKRQTREAIERSAIELVLERGLAGTTIEAIAERADVTSRTLFNHFADKEDALLGLPRDRKVIIEDVPLGDAHPTMFSLGAALARLELASITDETVELDQKRRTIVRENPTLLAREFDRYGMLEDALTEALLRYPEFRSVATDVHEREVRAVAFLLGAAIRLAVEMWCQEPNASDPLVIHFDCALQLITTAAAER